MIVYRLSKSKFASDLSGRGAEIAGGRWNSKGIPVVYTGESRALCVTEIAVHTELGNVPEDYQLISIEIPDEIAICKIAPEELPFNWNTIPHMAGTQMVGDNKLKSNNCAVIRVPSAVVPGDFNYLLNPRHRDFIKINIIKIEDFSFDKRLFIR